MLLGMSKSRGNGEGSVSKSGPPYIGRVSYWHQGKLKRKQCSGKTKAEVLAKMRKIRADVEGGFAGSEGLTVERYLTDWLQSTRGDVAHGTYAKYEQITRCHLIPALGRVRLGKLNPGHIERLKDSLVNEKGRSPGTANQILVTLSVALNQAVKWDLMPKNPVKAVRKVRDPGTGMACLAEEEAAELVEIAKGTRREALYQVALKCGLREGELLALRWSDVDLDRREINVARTVHTHSKEIRFGPTKTGESRTIVVPPSLVDALKRHHRAQLEDRMLAGPKWEDTGLVFCNEVGGTQRANAVLNRLRKDLLAADLPRVRFHDLRDTCATLALSHDVPLYVVSKILGHKDPAMTLRRYAHVLPDAKEKAAQAMEEYAF